MSAPLVPATLAHAPDGTPYSEAYGDVYHSAAGGPAQARHVFLAGNGLP
ncbi:MAG: transposase, partial [Burkholderiales bacterium]